MSANIYSYDKPINNGKGAPVDGDLLCSDLYGFPKGCIYVDTETGTQYIRTGETKAASDWTQMGSGSPTEFLYVSLVNRVFRIDGTLNGKVKYTNPDEPTDEIYWDGFVWYVDCDNGASYYYNEQDTTYPESGNWIDDATNNPVPLSITRYHGTLQEVLEQISKPKEWPKVYRALLSQAGDTSAPTAVVLDNTLGGEVVWTYGDVGSYVGTLSSAFNDGKTFLTPGIYYQNLGLPPNGYTVKRIDNNSIVVESYNNEVGSDGVLSNSPIQILVYP